jgi:hypothetical protein
MKNIVRFTVGVCLAAVALAWIPTVKAGERREEKKHPGMEYFEGKISSIDPATKTVVVGKKSGNMTFQVDPTCEFFAKGEKAGASFDDFKVGDKVNVLYKDVSGKFTAFRLAEEGAMADKKEKRAK